MSDKSYEILDDCLSRLDSGEDIESCLGRYPRQASELRPLLLAALDAASIAPAATVPPEIMKRGRAKLLNAAAEMRERKVARRPLSTFNLPLILKRSLAVLAVLLAFVLLGGTGLVRASSGALPGDQLYPVKRTWEQVLLQVIIDPAARANLEIEFEYERIDELHNLIDSGREAEVEFVGQVTGVFPDQLIVAGFVVNILPGTKMDKGVALDAWVEVEGQTLPDGSINANEIKLKARDHQEDSSNSASQGSGSDNEQHESSNSGSSEEQPDPERTSEIEKTDNPDSSDGENRTPEATQTPEIKNDSTSTASPQLQGFNLEGTIQNKGGSSITIAGKMIHYDASTEIRGTLSGGAYVKVRGVVQTNGTYLATRIEVISNSGGSATSEPTGSSGGSGSGSDDTPTPAPTDDHSGGGG